MTSSSPAATERLDWADAARGLSVTLIVVLHLWAIHLIYWIADAPVMSIITEVLTWTTPLRIPLFFFVSGYLASKSLARPWRQAWRSRVFGIAYLYVLWVACTTVFVLLEYRAYDDRPAVDPLLMMARNIISPETHLWYLWALIVLFIGVWCTRAVSGWIVLSAAGALSVAAPFFLEQPYLQVASAAVFYVAGARFPVIAAWATSRHRLWIFVCGAAIYVGSILLGPTGPYGLSDPITSTVGVLAMVAILAVVAHQRWMTVLRKIGKNTLPIFILNPFVFMLLNDLLLHNSELAGWLSDRPRGAAAYTAVMILVTLALSLGIKWGADRIGLRWLFAMPDRWLRAPSVRV